MNHRKGQGELLSYEQQQNPDWFGEVGQACATTVTAASPDRFYAHHGRTGPWSEGQYLGGTAFIYDGRGMGQLRRIVSHTGDTLTLERPWRVVPDASSRLCILRSGLIESLFASNDYLFSHASSGCYGAALRTVWTGEVSDSMSLGMVFWAAPSGTPMCLNVVQGLRFHEDAGVTFLTDRPVLYRKMSRKGPRKGAGAEEHPEWTQALTRMQRVFGNEVRNCYIVGRASTYTSNSRLPRTYRHRQVAPDQSWPIRPLPGHAAGVTIADRYAFGGTFTGGGGWERPTNDSMPIVTRWNLLFSNMLVRCPVGIEISVGVEKTILEQNMLLNCPVPIRDRGRGTIESNTLVRSGRPPGGGTAPKGQE
jgi:hypothetical protein